MTDYLHKLIQISNDYEAQTASNFQRALIAAHAQKYVTEVERFFRWLPGARAAGSSARAAQVDAAWKAVLDILFDCRSGLLATIAGAREKRQALKWRTFEKPALDTKRGATETAWECVASVIGIGGKTLRSEEGAADLPDGAFMQPDSILVRQLDALLK